MRVWPPAVLPSGTSAGCCLGVDGAWAGTALGMGTIIEMHSFLGSFGLEGGGGFARLVRRQASR